MIAFCLASGNMQICYTSIIGHTYVVTLLPKSLSRVICDLYNFVMHICYTYMACWPFSEYYVSMFLYD